MSTKQITQYYGPHARRWTSPATGEVLSLSPRDYETMVNTQMELDNMDRELAEAEKALTAAPRPKPHTTHPEGPNPLTGAQLWLGPDYSMEDYLKASGGWSTPRHFEIDDDSSIKSLTPDLNEGIPAALRARGGVRYPNPAPAVSIPRQDRPAARHLKRRKLRRAAAALVLVYIIFIIGATLAVGAL